MIRIADITHIPGDKPEDITVPCKLCGKPLKASFYWMLNRWIRPTIHVYCAGELDRKHALAQAQVVERPIPERFSVFEPDLFHHKEAHATASEFGPENELHVLAIIGPSGRGKSRLAWATIRGFFDQLEASEGAKRWIEAYLFVDLVTEYDKNVIAQIKGAKYVFIDDVGSVQSYGRERSQLQAAIRTRVQTNRWTFLSIDDFDFDPGLEDLLERAIKIYIK